MKRVLVASIFITLSAAGCNCSNSPAASHKDGGDAGNDGTTGAPDLGFDDSGNPIGGDGSMGPPDFGFDENGRPIDGGEGDGSMGSPDFGFDDMGRPIDGGVTGGDGSTSDTGPLMQPLPDFCSGMGTVVTVGGGGQCAGTIATNTFQFGLCTCDTFDVQSNLLIDSFDSSKGAYGATLPGGGTNIGHDGDLGVNQSLMMRGKLTVEGSTFVGGPGGFSVGQESFVYSTLFSNGPATQNNASTTLNHNAFINGDVTGRYNIAGNLYVPANATVSPQTTVGGQTIREAIHTEIPCPCAASEILDIQALVTYGSTHNEDSTTSSITPTMYENGGPTNLVLPCGRYYFTRINQPHDLSIEFQGRTVIFVDGNMTIGGGLTYVIDPHAEVDVFVTGDLSIGAAAMLGTPSAPSAVRTYVGGTGTIALSASAIFGGNLYAPRADVVFSASASLYGSLFAKHATFSGSANVHFDSNIRTAGQSCNPDAGPGDGSTGGGNDGAAGGNDGATGGNDGATGGNDGGTGGNDAGGGNDGGIAGNDTGSGGSDTGTALDSGVTPDTGVTPDSGTTNMCTNACTDCAAPSGCVIPAGASSGTCGACVVDTDCCAPRVCLGGMCLFPL